MDSVWIVILAGGASQRMGRDKLTLPIEGKTPLARSLEAALACKSKPARVVIAACPSCIEEARRLAGLYDNVLVCDGGETRGASALAALRVLGVETGVVAIHDAARCLAAPELFDEAIEGARVYGCGVAAVPVRDTLRTSAGESIPREGILAVQTPQAFDLKLILEAYEQAEAHMHSFTDDLGVWLTAGHAAHFTRGDLMNQKLTYIDDLTFFARAAHKQAQTRVGEGWDTHRLQEGRRLVLGGVEIPFEKGLLGHSDADALAHAVIDALLGAAALGDIGRHFPDTDARYQDICSMELMRETARMVREAGYRLVNVDATVIAQRPRLAPYIEEMRAALAHALACETELVSVKAKTAEGLNDEGRELCISARAVCALEREE